MFLVAVSLIIACHCSTMNRGLPYKYVAPLITILRIFYSGSTAWIVLASTSENGVPIAKLLNHRIFVHLNKLSYGIYLLNPVVVTMIYGLKDHSDHFTPITLVSLVTDKLCQLKVLTLIVFFPILVRYVYRRIGYCLLVGIRMFFVVRSTIQ